MTRERATQEAKKFLFDTDLLKPETRALILRDLLISACELEAAAMAEKCIEAIGRADGMVERGRKNAEAIIRSLSPLGVLEAHDQAVRLEGIEWAHKFVDHDTIPDGACEVCNALAALRATPQPTSVKEPTNG